METIFDKIPEAKKSNNWIDIYQENFLNKIIKILSENNSKNEISLNKVDYDMLNWKFWDLLKNKLKVKWRNMVLDYSERKTWWFKSWSYVDQRENWRFSESISYTYRLIINSII